MGEECFELQLIDLEPIFKATGLLDVTETLVYEAKDGNVGALERCG